MYIEKIKTPLVKLAKILQQYRKSEGAQSVQYIGGNPIEKYHVQWHNFNRDCFSGSSLLQSSEAFISTIVVMLFKCTRR